MFSNIKRRVGVVAAVTVMAALVPVLSTSNATAAPQTIPAAPSNLASYSACPANASIPSAGFTDTTSTDVDCLAYYGIPKGVTATTYEPSSSVTRWQMALYLTRAAALTGHTLGSGADQGFTDISGMSAEIQTAINQLAQLGVTTGTTATTYSPDNNVTREQMSMFIDRLLGKTAAGPGGAATNSSLNPLKVDLVAADVYNYADIDGGAVSFEGHNSIEELYNLGVPGHDSTVTAFSPAGDITRGDMATWMTNALAHTNLRPAGLTIQLSKTSGWANTAPTASVSYRTAAFAPVAGQVVDMFTWQQSTTLGNTSPWESDGNCDTNTNVNIVSGSLTKCTVDVGDPSTNASGNIAAGTITLTNAKNLDVYAHTATAGTKYDNDLHATSDSDVSMVSGTSTAQATIITITCDVSSKATESADAAPFLDPIFMKHGSTVNITLQMSAAINGGVYAPVAQVGNSITITHSIAQPNVATLSSVTNTTVTSDASGTATYSFTQADPNVNGASINDTADDVLHNLVFTDLVTQDGTTGAQTETVPGSQASGDGKPCWQDSQAAGMSFDFMDTVSTTASAVTDQVTTNVAEYKAAASALTPVSRTATATLRDKFGSNVANAAGNVLFTGSLNDPLEADADLTAVAAGGTNNALNFGAASATTYPVTTPVCFSKVSGTVLVGGVATTVGTTYYIQALGTDDVGGNAAGHSFTLSLTSGGSAATITGAATTDDIITIAHPTMGCAIRSVGPAGTASIAWNDTATTAGLDQIYAETSVGQSGAAEAGTTSYRWLAPSTTALGTTPAASTMAWVQKDGGTDMTCDAQNDVCGHPRVVDIAGSRMVVEIAYEPAGTGQVKTYTEYKWDDNDFYYLAEGGTATTMAGFTGAYVATNSGAYGLQGHLADGNGLAYANGDLFAVNYAALSGNISTFQLGN